MVVAQASVWLADRAFRHQYSVRTGLKRLDSIEDGTRKNRLIIFSTMPTAAASFKPRRLAIMVDDNKGNLDKSVLHGDRKSDF